MQRSRTQDDEYGTRELVKWKVRAVDVHKCSGEVARSESECTIVYCSVPPSSASTGSKGERCADRSTQRGVRQARGTATDSMHSESAGPMSHATVSEQRYCLIRKLSLLSSVRSDVRGTPS